MLLWKRSVRHDSHMHNCRLAQLLLRSRTEWRVSPDIKMQHVKKSGVGQSKDFGKGKNFGRGGGGASSSSETFGDF